MTRYYKNLATAAVGLLLCFTWVSCNRQAKTSEDMEHQHHQGHEDMVYSCPMHPEVTGKEGDKCPKCGMQLEPAETSKSADYKMVFSSNPKTIEAGRPVVLSFVPTNQNEDKAEVALDIVHDEPIHLIVVSEDLVYFNHIHPRQQDGEAYNVDITFPHGGLYNLNVDYKPGGGKGIVEKIPVNVQGKINDKVVWDQPKLISETDGYRVELLNAQNLKTGSHHTVDFRITKDGKVYKSKDLGTYLGAVAHIIMVGNKDKNFVHIHPDSGEEFPITAHVSLENPDLYRMWVQFKVDEKIITADFAVIATEGSAEEKGSHSAHPHQH